MKEKDLQNLFSKWLKINWKTSAAFELKMCKRNTFALSQLAEHQLLNLKLVKDGLFYYKLPDLGLQNPFDCFTLCQQEAYLVVFFYKPRQPKVFYMIPIITIQGLVDDGIKSFDEERAKSLAYWIDEV
jgi:hypothetical protein